MSWFDLDDEPREPRDYVSKRKRLAPKDKHISSKKEGKALRRLMARSGKTERELRASEKSARQELAHARNDRGDGANAMRLAMRDLTTAVAQHFGVPFYDERVAPAVKDLLEQRQGWLPKFFTDARIVRSKRYYVRYLDKSHYGIR